jgi:uncharacterized membrane protein YraQ (UPF0718 family)
MSKRANNKHKLKGKWLFLTVVILSYALTALIDFPLARESLSLFGDVLLQIIPILIVVLVLMTIINLLMTPDRIQTYLGKTSGVKGWLLAMAGGVLATGPIYTWYILIAELRKQGMQPSLAAAFLYSRAVKLPLLPLLVHYFGIGYTLILTFYLMMFSVLSGVVTGFLADSPHVSKRPEQ